MKTSSKPVVLQSINSADGLRCVDVFMRSDGTFGFAEYRRDFEDASGWQQLDKSLSSTFETLELALASAKKLVPWLHSPET